MSNRALALADTLERVLDTTPWQDGTYDPLTEENMREIVMLLRGEATRECSWRHDDDGIWHTGCGQQWVYTDSGTPREHGALFCYHCGGTLRVTSPQEGK